MRCLRNAALHQTQQDAAWYALPLPQEFGDSDHLVHSGMLASAQWLDERLSCIALGLHEAGFRVTLVGHSLGAGAVALLALMLRNKCVSVICARLVLQQTMQ